MISRKTRASLVRNYARLDFCERCTSMFSATKKKAKWIEFCLICEDEMLIYNLDAARRLPVFFHNTLSQHLEALRLYFTEPLSHLEISSHK